MDDGYRDGEGAHALDQNQTLDRFSGYGIVSGGTVTDGSNDFDVEVEVTNAFFNGTPVSPGPTVIDLREYVNSTNPRKVLICVDNNGNYVVEPGNPEQARPRGEIRFRTYRPAYPDLHGRDDVIPIAGVWIGASANGILPDDIEDRRQSADVRFRDVEGRKLKANVGITDASGTQHKGQLADASEIRTDAEITNVIDSDPDHGSVAHHNYYTDSEARSAVEDTTDAADLAGSVGGSGQHLVTDGTNALWQDMPGPENNQSLDTGDDVTFNSVTQQDATVNNQITWPDGTTTTSSPSAEAGNVAVFADLGDVLTGTQANRPSPSGSGDWYFTNDQNGFFYDDPNTSSWVSIAVHPSDIQTGDLPFSPVTADGSQVFTASQSMGGNNLTNLADPTAAQHAATQSWANNTFIAQSDESSLSVAEAGNSDTVDNVHANQFLRSDETTDFNIDGLGFRLRTVNNRSIITPLDGSGNTLTDNDFSFDTQIGEWNLEGEPRAGSSTILTRSDESGLSVESATNATNATNLTGGTSEWKVQNGAVVNGGHSDFSSAQAAIDFAANNGYYRVQFPPDNYDPITITKRNMVIEGTSRGWGGAGEVIFDGASTGITIDAISVTVRNCSVGSNTTNALKTTQNANFFAIEHVLAQRAEANGLYLDTIGGSVTGCRTTAPNIGADGIRLAADSADIVVYGNVNVGIQDNSGNNVIGANAT